MSLILLLVLQMHQDALLEMIPSTEFDLGKKLIGLDTIHHQIQNFSNYFVELPIAVFYVLLQVQRGQRHKRAPADNTSSAAYHDILYSYKCLDGTVVRFACGTLGNCHLYHTFEDLASLRRLF